MNDSQLLKLLNIIKKHGVDFDVALVGGMAVVGHGVRRGTLDFDLLVDTENFSHFQMAIARMVNGNDGVIPTLEDLGPLRIESSNPSSPGSPDNFKNGITTLIDWEGRRLLDFMSVYYSYEQQGIEKSDKIPGLEPVKLLDMPYLVLMKMQAGGAKDKSDIVELYKVATDEQRVDILDVAKNYRKIEALTRLLEAEDLLRRDGGNEP